MNIEEYLSDTRTEYLAKEYRRMEKDIESLDSMDQENMDSLVEEEKKEIRAQMDIYLKQMKEIKKEKVVEKKFPNEIVLEIRAGAGGDEASMFARDLSDMYEKIFRVKKVVIYTNFIF